MSFIEIRQLKKQFRQAVKSPGLAGAVKHLFSQQYVDKLAVAGIDLDIEEGETVAYVGPNGAGKSTTIKMLTGILVPTSGTVRVGGIDPFKNRMDNARTIGAVFGQRTQLWWDIPVSETFSLLKDIYEIPEDRYRRNLDQFIELLGMEDFLHLTARKLSLGQRMRADLAAALLHNPRTVYLDEPTIGLDIAVKQRIREFIKRSNKENGTTIMLTTHDLGDIEDLCNRLVIIDRGSLIYDGTLEAVKNRFARERVIHCQLQHADIPALHDTFDRMPGVAVESLDAACVSLRFDRFKATASEVISAVMLHGEVADFRIDEPGIEHVIKQVYERQLDLEDGHALAAAGTEAAGA
ncbi:ABC transporter ATP-binding protein [Paenibacillus kobensis]|uniref:ABC transporter ATP-binding protein n=1 Tax=Paenibacillus kobensis TaxID=59841 RepID=UPI000FDAC34A|nr:ATP-binding cassette domain-containing protein [Paenibacillus kobensis]